MNSAAKSKGCRVTSESVRKPPEVSLIEDFLRKKGMKRSLDAFEKEWPSQVLSSPPMALLSSFERGEGARFFRDWTALEGTRPVPAVELSRLEFSLRVYFAIHSALQNKGEPSKEAMAEFRHFLEEKGAELAKEPELIPFFALPYAKNLREHSSFSHLFRDDWALRVREALHSHLTSVSDPEKVSDLERLLEREAALRAAQVETPPEPPSGHWAALLSEAVEIGRKLGEGAGPGDAELLDRLGQLEAFVDFEAPERGPRDSAEQVESSRTGFFPLDFGRLKAQILESRDTQFVAAALQALRWRVSRGGGALGRREAAIQISSADVLNTEFVGRLLERRNRAISENAVALINAVASEGAGRSYLAESTALIRLLISTMKAEPRETFVRTNCLGALQKLSLRKRAQEALVAGDVVKWTLNLLSAERAGLSDYSLEYSAALLLNLSLRSGGKDKFEEVKHSALTLLATLMKHDNPELKSFVNGTLYSLFTRPAIRKLALEMGFERKLKELISKADETLEKRLRYILDLLTSDVPETNLSELNEDEHEDELLDEDEDFDEEESETPQEVPWHRQGEDLLSEFKLEGEEAERQINIVSAILEETISQSKLDITRSAPDPNPEFIIRQPARPWKPNKAPR